MQKQSVYCSASVLKTITFRFYPFQFFNFQDKIILFNFKAKAILVLVVLFFQKLNHFQLNPMK